MSIETMSSEFDHSDRADADRAVPSPAVALFDSLSDARRCLVVFALADRSPLTEAELAAHVLERDRAPTSSQRVQVSLRHHHLPKLAATGVVDYDPETGVADRGPRFDAAQTTLEGTCARCAGRDGS